jgi:hypothetical protein
VRERAIGGRTSRLRSRTRRRRRFGVDAQRGGDGGTELAHGMPCSQYAVLGVASAPARAVHVGDVTRRVRTRVVEQRVQVRRPKPTDDEDQGEEQRAQPARRSLIHAEEFSQASGLR